VKTHRPEEGAFDVTDAASAVPAVPRTLSAAPPPLESTEEPIHVLVVDDEPGLRRTLARVLGARGLRVGTAEDGVSGLEYIERHTPDVALVDMRMPRLPGLDLLTRVKEEQRSVEVIMMTAYADVDAAVASVKAGAYHFLTKPFHSNDTVALAVLKAAEHKRLVERAHKLEERLLSKERFGELVGTSPKMEAIYRLIEGVATTTSTVLVLGESGTGKELVARAIHQRSSRSQKPFVAVNCAAIPRELVESELFGHVRGAFTGAQTARAGLFESANGGTLFLDEVGDLPLAAQVKLLRALQEGEIKRVGSDETRTVDVRVLAATNVDLAQKIDAGSFRKDLFYRLNVIALRLPPLRERGDDVVLLSSHFIQKLARRMDRDVKRLSPDAVRALRAYAWPGNVRELEHAIEYAFVLSQGDVIHATDLPFVRARSEAPMAAPAEVDESGVELAGGFVEGLVELPYAEAKKRLLTRFDDHYTEELLRRTNGNLSEAARRAGLDRSNFRRIMRRRRAG
jgi:DNA-binding NtrC family response regulator